MCSQSYDLGRESRDPLGRRPILALDWNGTVVADVERAHRSVATALAAEGLKAPDDLADFRMGWRLPLAEYFRELGVPPARLEAVEWAWNASMAESPADMAVGARSLLAWCSLSRVPVVVLSAAVAETIQRDARELGIAQYLSLIIDRAHPKAECLARLRRRGATVVYVGDTEYDVLQARIAGVTPIAFGAGYRPREPLEALGVPVVTDLREVINLLPGQRGPVAGGRA